MTNCSGPLILIKSVRVYLNGSDMTGSKVLVGTVLYEICYFYVETSIQQRYISCLQRMKNRGIQLSCNLKKYDHVSSHRLDRRWLSVQDQIKN